MSVKIMAQVWELDLPQNQKLVLLAFADHADDDGICYPSVARIAWKSGYSERQIKAIGKELRAAGLMELVKNADGGRGKTAVYKIRPEKGAKLSPFSARKGEGGNTVSAPKGCGPAQERVKPGAQKGEVAAASQPSKEPSEESSRNPGGRLAAPAQGQQPASGSERKGKTQEAQPERVDPRYQLVVDAISKCWPEGVPFAFDKTDGKQLKGLLERRPKSEWSVERLQECVVFRFWSDCTVPSESVRKWIGALTDYAFGPLDRFKQPKFSEHQLEGLRRQARIFLGLEQQPQPAAAEPIPPPPGVRQTTKAEEAWKAILEDLARAINPHTFSTWFRPTKGYGEKDGTLFVHVPTRLFRKRLTETYSDQVKQALHAKPSGFTEIEFICLTTG
jgi:hypothetical protein